MADGAEFDEVFQREHSAVFKAVYLVLGDREAARDITQDAFAQLFVHWRKVGQYERPGAWVRHVAVRMALRSKRRSDRSESIPTGVDLDGQTLERLDLVVALRHLTVMQRAAVVLFYLYDLTVDEVAANLGCRPSTARVHLHNARHGLELLLKESHDVAR